MTTITPRKSLLGEQTAENDRCLLLNNYIETSEYRAILETKDSTVVVGRRGTGKSAMFLKLIDMWTKDKHSKIITISPEDSHTLYFRGIFTEFEKDETKYQHVRAITKILLKYGVLLEILSGFLSFYKSRNDVQNNTDIGKYVTTWGESKSGFLIKIAKKYHEIDKGKGDLATIIGNLRDDLLIDELEYFLVELVDKYNPNFYLLIDRLDEGYENDYIGAAVISGIISVIAEMNKKYERVRAVVFLRDNVLRLIQKFDPDYTRNIEGEVISIHWDSQKLLTLVAKRLNSALNLKLENSQKIWDRCTADTGTGRELKGEDGFKKCLQFTLYRPRDLLSLLNKAFFFANCDNRNTIIIDDVETTAKEISSSRLEDLKKEYSKIVPAISVLVSSFDSTQAEMSYSEALQLIDNNIVDQVDSFDAKTQQDINLLQSDGLLRSLYSVGFIGIKDNFTKSFVFCHDGRQPEREFFNNDKVLIHPCYWISLNLSKNALSSEDAEQIDDEYEIKVSATQSNEIRTAKIGTLIASIGNIKMGVQDATNFEKWLLDAVKAVFAGQLSNIELHPNGSATQRRDVVGTNLATAKVWSRIEKNYGVSQVIFEAKNFESLSIEEYRQMTTYLTGSYGRLGFIVTRDRQEEISGPEVNWIREMYYTNDKLIIRLSYKFFTSMLSKLRTPEKYDAVDSYLSKVLDRYERNYLSLPSSNVSRSKK